ncbi:MAG: histidine phosphatase family protein [Gammaproteobacteria bacterium]|nr:histidine phosphatase family protein [Gammaproteobacteria bacterium]
MPDNFRLLLLRHGKSSWDSSAKNDFDRPLDDRGHKDAARVGQYISRECPPELIISSPALRARQTCLAVCEQLNRNENTVRWQDDLYLASLNVLVSTLDSAMQKSKSLLLIGHNPGFDDLLEYLSGNELPLTDSGKLMTTAALAVVEIPAGIVSLAEKCGQLKRLVRPADLR